MLSKLRAAVVLRSSSRVEQDPGTPERRASHEAASSRRSSGRSSGRSSSWSRLSPHAILSRSRSDSGRLGSDSEGAVSTSRKALFSPQGLFSRSRSASGLESAEDKPVEGQQEPVHGSAELLAPVLAAGSSRASFGASLPPLSQRSSASGAALGAALPPIGAKQARLVEALAYLLEPLVEAAGAPSKKDKEKSKEQGVFTLGLLLRLVEAANERALQLSGERPAAKAKGGATVQQETAARRARQLVAGLQTEGGHDRGRAVIDLSGLIEHDAAIVDLSGLASRPEPALAAIVEQMERGGAEVREQATLLLRKLSEHSDALSAAVRQTGAIKVLVRFVAGGTKGLPRVEAAAALTALARGHFEAQQAIAAAGAVPPLVKMLKAEGKHAAPGEGAAAALCLCTLMAQHAENTALVLAQGGLPALARMVLPLVYRATQLHAANGASGALQALHRVLQAEGAEEPPPSEAAAVAALRRLAAAFPPGGAPGLGLELLRKMVALADSAEKGGAHAAAALLVLVPEVEPALLVEAGAVPVLVRCLGELERGEVVRGASAAALIRLAHSGVPGRAAVVERTAQLLTRLSKDGGGAEQIVLVLAATGGLSEARFAAGAAKSVGRPLVRLSKRSSREGGDAGGDAAAGLVSDAAAGLLIGLAQYKHEVPATP